ncbi:NAC domain-containing protein 62-like [Gastrolobium bilobum]|uniref:NAC domain-containing protein 62-like n=1 Tax=Gastrolobium bilobum TaxID=150636 RepID=UPI002AB09D1E|nr:NAC domain-containing protein 62-like [Gastrolobium bilobum]
MGAAVDCYAPPPPRRDEIAVLSLNSLPLGFRFRPTDEELVDYYLRQKINGNGADVWVIREIDVCRWEPWDLPDLSVVRNKDPEWFFFCPQDRKYPNGHRLNRATSHGYWKATGKDRRIKSGSTLIGMKKTLVFYTGRAPKGKRTNWVMHEYRPTLKELDGTNPGQNPYVLCRLFKKQDESLEASNCDEVEQTASTPTTANNSPEEIQSDPTLVPVSSSQATEDDKHLVVIAENSEEAISNVITPVDCHSNGCDAYDALNQIVQPAAEEDQLLNLDIFYDLNGQWDDKLFSPLNVIPPEFYYQANNELDGCCGPQHQYGTNETNILDYFDSVVNWDECSYERSSCLKPNSTVLDVEDNGSCIDSDVGMANMRLRQSLHGTYPKEAIEQKSDVGLFQNNSQMALSTDVSMGQVYNDYEQSRNYDTVDTGIRIRNRQGRNEPDMVQNPMMGQGDAPRRLRLVVAHQLDSNETAKDGSCTPEDHDSKTTIAGEREASENHAAVENASDADANDVDEQEKTSPQSAETRKISQQHVATAESIFGLKDFLLEERRVRYTSKASTNRAMWSSVLAVSAIVLVLLVVVVNICGYLRISTAY